MEPLHPLKLGDRVALLAPSSPLGPGKLQTSMDSVRFLGLEPVLYASCTGRRGFLAGSDELRADDLNHAFADPEIKGIFCVRGGYGAMRLLPLLDLDLITKNPKVFVGYSDITALHTIFNQQCGFPTLHGPMPSHGYARLDHRTLESLSAHLFTGISSCPPVEGLSVLVPGHTSGPLCGGNLSLLAGTLGSPYEVDCSGKILFLEDVGEDPYRIDKDLVSLALAGKFSDCAGVILGYFEDCSPEPEQVSLSLASIFRDILVPFGKPVVNWFPAGHVFPQLSLPMGLAVRIDASPHSAGRPTGKVEFLSCLTGLR